MIPLSCKEGSTVTHTDEDGVVYTFKPKSGLLENEFFDLTDTEGHIKESTKEYLQREKDFFDKVVLKIDPKDKYKITGEKLSEFYTSRERGIIVGYWHTANFMTDEEKKS